MRKFLINVNGVSYEVEVEEIDSPASVIENAVAPEVKPVAAPKAAPAAPKAPVAVKAPAASGKGTKLVSPLPGVLLKFVVPDGSTVKTNDVVVIVEAMKMENEVRANADGVIKYAVNQGANLNNGDVIAYIA